MLLYNSIRGVGSLSQGFHAKKKVEFDRLVLSPPALPLYRGRDISPWRPLLQMDGAWTVNSLLENVIAEDWARWVCFQMLKVQYNINNIYPLCIYVCTICVYIYCTYVYIHKVYRQCNFYRNVTFLVMDKSSFFPNTKAFCSIPPCRLLMPAAQLQPDFVNGV